jgi:hypothetical protein
MKKIFATATVMVALGLSFQASAQQDSTTGQKIRKEAKEVGQDVKEGAEKAGDKTAEIAVKGASTVTDKVYRDKVGPKGQTIYIDGHSRYYWVDDKGKKIYVPASKLKDKKD